MQSARNPFRSAVIHSLSRLGVEIRLTGRRQSRFLGRPLPYEATLLAASEAGLSVGDYLDAAASGVPGATQNTIDQMRALNVFARKIENVVEIGPGAGRHMAKTLKACSPTRYEFYEPAADWAHYVERTYGTLRQPVAGHSLAASASESAELVQAHEVFSALDLVTTMRYWPEMARVARSGGFVVFDVVTESCLDPATVDQWTASGVARGCYPAAIPRQTVLRYFDSLGFYKIGTFISPMGPGTTEVFVFRKR